MELTQEQTSAIKGLAILCMLWHHLFLDTLDYGSFVNGLAVLGKVCVCLFLFVSGYGLTKQFDKIEKHSIRNTILFVIRRYAKFFMSYWFCFIVVIMIGNLCGYTITEAYPQGRNHFKCFLFDLFGCLGYESYLSTWWFNKLIIQLYLIFPFLFLLLRKKVATLLGLAIFFVVEQFSLLPFFFVIEGGLVAFYLGMIFGQWGKEWKVRHLRVAFWGSIALVVALISIRFELPEVRFMIVDGFIALGVGVIISLIGGRYGFPILRFFGQYATIMYLTHTLFHRLFGKYIYSLPFAPLCFLLFLAIATIAVIVIQRTQLLCRYDKLQAFVLNKINCIKT